MGWRRSRKGQASVMIGMMMLTFMLFFAFVINTGMLVNAKINLQNAADMAAYSGAAVQARQLDQIAFLNYEMRRQYKKFLYRYYVVGNFAQKSHPGNGGAVTGRRIWSPDYIAGNSNYTDYQVPTVCVIYNQKDNFCQLVKLNKISIPNGSSLDSIQQTLIAQLKKLEDLRQTSCKEIGATNLQILYYWLWNTDPTLKTIEASLAQSGNTAIQDILKIIKGLSFGLGLIPRELLLKKRVDTLASYVNFAPQSNLTKAKVDALSKQGDVPAKERSVQAFLSAYNTLGTHTFDNTDSIVLDELLPKGTAGASLLNLKPINVGFDAYAVDFELLGGNGTIAKDCQAKITPMSLPDEIPVGVTKDRKMLTYYAVRLTANAKLLFSPFGEMRLKAYAAAQPFGSRIGPDLSKNDFLRAAAHPQCNQQSSNQLGGIGCRGFVPNLPVKDTNDSTATGQGWDNNEVIYAMYQKLAPQLQSGQSGQIPASITPTELGRAYQAAMVPNPYEGGKYSIFNDLNADGFVQNFDQSDTLAFWAPVVSPDSPSSANPDQEVKDMINTLFQGQGNATANNTNFNQDFKNALQRGISQYFADLKQGRGEDGEGFNIVRLRNPFHTNDPGQPPQPIRGLATTLMLDNPDKVKASWDSSKYAGDAASATGRTGYSVKFVSFRTLMKKNISTDGQGTTWNNDLSADSEAEQDLPMLQH